MNASVWQRHTWTRETKEKNKGSRKLLRDRTKLPILVPIVAASRERAVCPEPATEKRADSGSLRTYDQSHLSAVSG